MSVSVAVQHLAEGTEEFSGVFILFPAPKVEKLQKTNTALRSQVDSLSLKVDTLEQFKTDASSCLDRCAR